MPLVVYSDSTQITQNPLLTHLHTILLIIDYIKVITMLSTLNILGLLLLPLATPLTTPTPSDNTIQLGLGTKPVNIGSLRSTDLRDALIKTQRTACPDATQPFCGVVPAGIIANAAFPVYTWSAQKRRMTASDLVSVVVEIECMRWNAYGEIHDI